MLEKCSAVTRRVETGFEEKSQPRKQGLVARALMVELGSGQVYSYSYQLHQD